MCSNLLFRRIHLIVPVRLNEGEDLGRLGGRFI